jgi:hypothetical protein
MFRPKRTLILKWSSLLGDILKISNFRRQLTIGLILSAVVLAGASISAIASSPTYVCVNKTSGAVYLKAKCSLGETRTAIATNGANGRDGAAGTSGAGVYETWLKAGNSGSVADFLKSLQGKDGAAGANGSNASLPFFERLESNFTCDEKWRLVTSMTVAPDLAAVNRQAAMAGCPQPDWTIQPFQLPASSDLALVSTTYGTPVYTAQQVRRNNAWVDNPYASKLVSVPYTAVVSVHAPSGWALCTDTDPQIAFVGGSGYPKLTYFGSDAMDYSIGITNNRATISDTLTFSSAPELTKPNYLTVSADICGVDNSTPSGLTRKSISADLILPPVTP